MAQRRDLTQLFSWDPATHPRRACPQCGWQTFWQHENCAVETCQFQCERCHRVLIVADLVAPATEAPRCIDCERLIANPARTGQYCALCYRGAA